MCRIYKRLKVIRENPEVCRSLEVEPTLTAREGRMLSSSEIYNGKIRKIYRLTESSFNIIPSDFLSFPVMSL